MTFAYWCILIAALMPLIWVGVAKSSLPGYDNDQPRRSLAQAEGRAQRAHWAEQNALEAFAPFAAGVIVAHLTGGAEPMTINVLAGLFIAARLVHGAAYIANRGPLRSFAWLAGMICIIGLFVAAA
jgi:uncharacterized MAPEG superfamily protein